jgi:hypothetical protein
MKWTFKVVGVFGVSLLLAGKVSLIDVVESVLIELRRCSDTGSVNPRGHSRVCVSSSLEE